MPASVVHAVGTGTVHAYAMKLSVTVPESCSGVTTAINDSST
jgi:hypothetical protein